jgi:hypothetical protein
MLERIINIKPEFKYRDGRGSGFGFQKFFQTANQNRTVFHDSISLSPAAVFLSKINWQLKEMTISSKEKLNIIISVSDFEFGTELDFLSFYSTQRQYFDVAKIFISAAKSFRLLLNISAKKNRLKINDNLERIPLSGLTKLLDRIFSLEINGVIDKYDSLALRDLMDGIDEDIINDFNYINNALYTLVSKIGNFNLPENYLFNDDRTEPIIIEKITAING